MMPALGAIGSAWLVGALIVTVLWPRERSLRGDGVLILALGLGVGFGATSIFYFGISQLTDSPRLITIAVEWVVGAVLATAIWVRRSAATPGSVAQPGWSWSEFVAVTLLMQAGVVAAVVATRALGLEPFGSQDAWAIWNLHARLMFRGGAEWAELLQRPEMAWSHLDYPLLVSASVGRGWSLVGHDGPLMAGLVSILFAVATIGVLVATAATLRSRVAGWIGGLLLLGTPFFVTFSPNQHADIPLGFFMLATLAVGALSRRSKKSLGLPALAGVCAGFAAWTKNEGLLFALVIGAGGTALGLRRDHRRATLAFLVALALALLPVLQFKFFLAPANDLVGAGLGHRLGNLFDASRHGLILSAFGRDAMRFGEWAAVPFVVMVLPLFGTGGRRLTRVESALAASIAVTAAGYYAVYLITPWDLAWHLDTSLVRLLLQLWPALIFFWCLALPPLETAPVAPRGFRRLAVGGANVVLALALLFLLGRQRAANEFAMAYIGGERTSLVTGEGWFARESDGQATWQWSKGDSVLFLHRRGGETAPVTLRFELRGLGQRSARLMQGERVVWQGAVSEALKAVEIPGLMLAPGTTEFRFATDAPGVLESSGPGARALTFAIYDPTLK